MRLTISAGSRGAQCLLCFVALLLPGNLVASANQPSSNWADDFEPCHRSAELFKRDHMELGVWIHTSNTVLAAEFRRAMNFWADVLDLTWHEEDTLQCSIQVFEGSPALFAANNITAARSQFTERANFYGWIAFNPRCPLSGTEMYLTAVHEIGHILGLRHNLNPRSVMYFLNPEGPARLDRKDFAVLAARHKLRSGNSSFSRFRPTLPFQATPQDRPGNKVSE
jgi:Matrixin